MNSAARAFLDEERTSWQPFEALDRLEDGQLEAGVAAAHGWSGRDLIAHLIAWLDDAVEVARELQAGEVSEARERSRRAFAARGDEINAEIQAAWRPLAIAEVRARMRLTLAELRQRLASLPRSRWTENPEDVRFFHIYTVEHYEDHVPDLEAILRTVTGSR